MKPNINVRVFYSVYCFKTEVNKCLQHNVYWIVNKTEITLHNFAQENIG